MTLRFIEKVMKIWQEKKSLIVNGQQKKQLRASASVIVNNTTSSLEKAVSPTYRIITKVWATDASGATNLKNYKKWLNVIESELKARELALSSDVAVVLTPVLDIAKNVTSTR